MTALLIFNRALTDKEIADLSRDPYQIFRPLTWRDRLKSRLRNAVYFAAWQVLPHAWCARIWGEQL